MGNWPLPYLIWLPVGTLRYNMAMTSVHDFLVVTFRCHVAIQGSMQTHRLNSTVLAAVLPRSAFAYIGCGLECGFVTKPSYDYSKPTFENYREDSFWQGYDVTYINTHTRVHVCVWVRGISYQDVCRFHRNVLRVASTQQLWEALEHFIDRCFWGGTQRSHLWL